MILSLVGIVLGADYLVDGSVSIARKYKVSDFVIGAAIIGVGTSTPEMTVSFIGALNGNADVAIGNVVGSNIFTIVAFRRCSAVCAGLNSSLLCSFRIGCSISVYGLVYRKSGNLSGCILLEFNISDLDSLYSLVRRHLGVEFLDLCLEILLNVADTLIGKELRIWEYLSDNCDLVLLDTAFTRINYDLAYTFNFLKVSFDFFRIDILSIGENDEILLATCNIYPAFFIKFSIIAGMEEAILVEDLCCRFRIVIISEHHIRAFGYNLALACFRVHIVKLKLDIIDRISHHSHSSPAVHCITEEWGSLSKTISDCIREFSLEEECFYLWIKLGSSDTEE